ncbi:sulfatase family protein [Crateriforma conspicua]|uniref:sulfatase family protein n=1 Tax=Crateriforma conspicua TaxID=2527996 RepID=UPI0018C8AE36|nr:sulfatase-like hydrolase/transferase [Crateriforma conspicua]
MRKSIDHRGMIVLLVWIVVTATSGKCWSDPSDDQRRPNVVIIFTDDHGYSDLGCQGIVSDIRTPNIDRLAQSGVRFTDGYVTAPQCVPSRGGLITGQYQNRFGLESNPQARDAKIMANFARTQTIPERLQAAGYATGMSGKWHLGAPQAITSHGFDHVFFKNSNAQGFWNMDLQGQDIPPTTQKGGGYHLDLISDFACAFIERYKSDPFFFYLAYRAPHVPLDAPKKYLDRFPGDMPQRRRQALAMLSAVDDGVGRVMATLESNGLRENTLIFLISDNGAPLKIHKADTPGGGPGWDGSLNDPMNGEKGMLTEGGIRTPFVGCWPGTFPGGQVYSQPVISLDAMATTLAAAGLTIDDTIDGVNLLPFLTGESDGAPHDALYWRWLSQSAVRQGKWKYIRSNDREFLFDLETDASETTDLTSRHPDQVRRLRTLLTDWSQGLSPPGIGTVPSEAMSRQADLYFDYYIDGILRSPTKPKRRPNRQNPKPESGKAPQ